MSTRPTASNFSLKTAYVLLSLALASTPALLKAQTAVESSQGSVTSVTSTEPGQTGMVETVGQLSTIPIPSLSAKAWLTLDVNSGQVIAGQNITDPVEPASLTKIMAAYIVFQAIKNNRLSLDQTITISEKAWKTEGSRMFVEVNSQVSVDDLLKGVIIQSGNDATVALAEGVAGSESAFVAMMNQEADKMGLTNTHFTNSSGLPHPDHMTTVQDLGILAMRLVQDFPEFLHYYSQKEYTYNKIKQLNRNRLLWSDPTVDGLKTGHTSSAGYCLVTTALRDGRRVVSVLVGAASDSARAESSLKLLNWSFQNFDTIKLYDEAKPAVQARVWEGTAQTVDLGQPAPLWVTVPRGKAAELKPVAQYTQPLVAPLTKGTQVGTLTLTLDGKELQREPLIILNDVSQASFIARMIDKVKLLLQ